MLNANKVKAAKMKVSNRSQGSCIQCTMSPRVKQKLFIIPRTKNSNLNGKIKTNSRDANSKGESKPGIKGKDFKTLT